MKKEGSTGYKYFDPAMLARVQNMKLAARLIVDGFTTGRHKSHFRGFNVEFSQHRQYMPGDEIRNIDWKIFARSDKFFVKEFEEDTNLKAYILIDCSKSMLFKPDGALYSKFDYACFLAIAMSYVILKQQDSAGLVTFADRVINFIPPSSNTAHFKVILEELEEVRLGKRTNISESFHELAARIKRRGLILILTDLYDDENEVIKSLKHLRHKHHEVAVFHLLSKYETELPASGETRFVDLESGSEIITNAETLRSDYQKALEGFITDFKRRCHESFIDYNLVTIDTPVDEALSSYLRRRARR